MIKKQNISVVFIMLFLSVCISSFSQNGYNILYIHQFRDKNMAFSPKTNSYTRLLFNDHHLYSYSFDVDTKDPANDEYPDSKIGHAVLAEVGGIFNYYKIFTKSKKYWYRDTLRTFTRKWIFTDEEKKILGYTCRKAYLLNEYFLPATDSVKTWIRDSTIAWHTDQIQPAVNVFTAYYGLPGTVLEIHDQNKRGWYARAIAVTRQPVNIKFPETDLIKILEHTNHPK
jgi:GLPGLI family protein